MTRRTELHTCQGNVTGLYYSVTEPIVAHYARPHGMHSAFKKTMQKPVVHMLSEISCSFTES